MDKKNIVFFLPNFSYGGAGNSILNICKYLNKKKYKIFVLSINNNFYKNELSKYCQEVVQINAVSTLMSLNKIKHYLKKFDKKDTLIVSNINYANALFVIYFKVIHKFKLILIERTPLQELFTYFSFKDFTKKLIIKFIIKFFYKKADKVIANSRKTANDFTKFTKKKCQYVYPLTIKKIERYKRKKLNRKGIINCMTISRLSKEKNLIEILSSMKDLNNKRIFFNILGNGDEKNNLKKFIRENKISSKIFSYSEKNKYKLFKICKLYICSSYFEGFPNAIVEALNNNIPVLSSNNHGGINEILSNNKGGETYKVGNKHDLIYKIKKILDNYGHYTKKTLFAKKKLSRFTNKNIKNYEKIFDQV